MIEVMIVEDDPMVAELNRRYLEQVEGFELQSTAASGKAALEKLDSLVINLVLLDIYMPGMNGLELLKKLRQSGKGVDVIVVSAARDSQSINEALRHGAVDYLIKPFELIRFKEALVSYKKRVDLLAGGKINQTILDNQILGKEEKGGIELPKGLDRHTLQLIWQKVKSEKGQFTTEEMAIRVGISRVSMRKYLEFFHQVDLLQMDIAYGTKGRPAYQYHCIKQEAPF